ncbi:FimB/Mfa2 family fimbrial subunit [Phocaeicola plebeius]|uniref:FimB/Mfa2 family fimbrial subunit n=1 Tax=Phocaeicola plebeius TaxID=310297 RepID=UPI0030793C8A
MNKTRYIIGITTAATLLLTSCIEDELFNTPHPDHGKVAVTVDWSNRGEGVDIPTSLEVNIGDYTWEVNIGDYTGTETSAIQAPAHLFEPGNYTLVTHNPANGIAISGTTATVATTNGSFITANPDWLLTAVQEVTINADTDHEFTVSMVQQVRELTLIIEPRGDAADRIESIEGKLSGAAGSMDFATDTHGTPSEVELSFTKITSGADAGRWTATVRLLGIAGNAQQLTATLTYTDDNPRSHLLESDLTASLADFNADKTTPLALGGTIAETPTEADFSATITDWEKVTEGPIDVK